MNYKFKTKACHNCGYAIVQQSNIWNGHPDKEDPNLLLEKCPFCNAEFYYEEEIEELIGCQTILDRKVYAKYIYGNPEKEQLYQARTKKELEEIYKQSEEQELKEKELKETQLYEESNIPKCPTCGSTNIRHISATERGVNAFMFGIFGTKRKHQFECQNPNCKYRW